jgi:hypothetical protein
MYKNSFINIIQKVISKKYLYGDRILLTFDSQRFQNVVYFINDISRLFSCGLGQNILFQIDICPCTGSSCIGGHLNNTDYRLIRYLNCLNILKKTFVFRQKCLTSKFSNKKNNTAPSHIQAQKCVYIIYNKIKQSRMCINFYSYKTVFTVLIKILIKN